MKMRKQFIGLILLGATSSFAFDIESTCKEIYSLPTSVGACKSIGGKVEDLKFCNEKFRMTWSKTWCQNTLSKGHFTQEEMIDCGASKRFSSVNSISMCLYQYY